MTWNTLPTKIDPVAFEIGNFQILWYSISYILAFATTYLYLYFLIKKRKVQAQKIFKTKNPLEEIETLFVFCLIGLFLGAKIGFVLFYDIKAFLGNPLEAFMPFKQGSFVGFSGLSFHGAVIGIILAGILFCKIKKVSFLKISNFIILAVPLGYFWGRLGNFMNGELYGRITESPLGMCFPKAGTCELGNRHPSQIYEALGEGLLIFIILWFLHKKSTLRKFLFPLWLILYGFVRFLIEFFREPDSHLGLLALNLSMGQILCFLMIMIGFILLVTIKRKREI